MEGEWRKRRRWYGCNCKVCSQSSSPWFRGLKPWPLNAASKSNLKAQWNLDSSGAIHHPMTFPLASSHEKHSVPLVVFLSVYRIQNLKKLFDGPPKYLLQGQMELSKKQWIYYGYVVIFLLYFWDKIVSLKHLDEIILKPIKFYTAWGQYIQKLAFFHMSLPGTCGDPQNEGLFYVPSPRQTRLASAWPKAFYAARIWIWNPFPWKVMLFPSSLSF